MTHDQDPEADDLTPIVEALNAGDMDEARRRLADSESWLRAIGNVSRVRAFVDLLRRRAAGAAPGTVEQLMRDRTTAPEIA